MARNRIRLSIRHFLAEANEGGNLQLFRVHEKGPAQPFSSLDHYVKSFWNIYARNSHKGSNDSLDSLAEVCGAFAGVDYRSQPLKDMIKQLQAHSRMVSKLTDGGSVQHSAEPISGNPGSLISDNGKPLDSAILGLVPFSQHMHAMTKGRCFFNVASTLVGSKKLTRFFGIGSSKLQPGDKLVILVSSVSYKVTKVDDIPVLFTLILRCQNGEYGFVGDACVTPYHRSERRFQNRVKCLCEGFQRNSVARPMRSELSKTMGGFYAMVGSF
ncbi:hypothetical protein P154DRAFT_575410 [Amniculicola lignicola CBS 123094]|uniref:Uncharacterized protein n=1 Tax=Amniculicola lignicola CBS 123094 TaxID=1392246 RepID=A0A6A5WJP9_9PLEO|nr:hypothetical protein P154DRAFT_575410 [Amniculicola lignicola CBS 123094]